MFILAQFSDDELIDLEGIEVGRSLRLFNIFPLENKQTFLYNKGTNDPIKELLK